MEMFGRFLLILTLIMIIVAFVAVYFRNRPAITVIEVILYAVSHGVRVYMSVCIYLFVHIIYVFGVFMCYVCI
jgi:hypothetical protein